ncbi:alpha,alpha-trehalase, partial [Ancylostoma caninum]
LKYPIEKEKFHAFCRTNFENVPYLKNVTLPDFKARPRFLDLIQRKDHLKLAESLHFLWNKLSREFSDDVRMNASFYPIVPVNNAFIVPGGRFQIFFYWDSYWILKGLYLSELVRTAKGMIQNFADIIERHGFIPNSGSIQLSRRSQPPLFVQMVKDYFNVTKNVESLRRWIPFMDKEMRWWMEKRSVGIALPSKRTAFVYVYRTETNCPRPENFLSDYYLGMNNTDPLSSWTAMATACESGWDFSSRWFDHEGERKYEKVTIRTQTIVPVDLNVYMALNMKFLVDSHAMLGNHSMSDWYRDKYNALLLDIHDLFWNQNEGVWFDYDLKMEKQRTPRGHHEIFLDEKVTIRTQTIVPVDLNVYMALNMKFLADSHAMLGNHSMSDWYRNKYNALLLDIHDLFWNQNEGVWFDYDLKMEKQRTEFYPSNVFPLLLPEMQSYAGRVYNYLEKLDVYRFPGGVPSTLPVKSVEQWDFPNVWAPTQHLFIQSLLLSQHSGLQQRGLDEANKFITTVFNGLLNPQKGMPAGVWEKYDARSSGGKPGGGGEYVVQEGFGWTNGVVMDLINLVNTHHASVRLAETRFLGDPGRAVFVIVALAFLLLLATWFAVCGHYGHAWFPPQRVAHGEEQSSQRLLDDSDSND